MTLQRLTDWLLRTAFRANAAALPPPLPTFDAADPEYAAIIRAYQDTCAAAKWGYVRAIEDATKACAKALAEHEARRREDAEANE